MSTRSIKAGSAYVELFAEDSKLVRGLHSAQRRLTAFASSVQGLAMKMAGLSAAIVAPLTLAVKSFMQTGDALDKMSSRVGASVEFLSALSHAAQIGGTDIAAMETAIRRLQRTAYDATRGLSTATQAFADLGINIRTQGDQLKSTEQLFMESAAALSRMENNTRKAALATVVFGRAGTELLPMLKDGKAGLLAVMEEAHRLGIVMTTEDATAAAASTDAWTRLVASLKRTAVLIGKALAPMLEALAEKAVKIVGRLMDWIKTNPQLIVKLAKFGLMLGTVGTALAALTVVIKLAAVAMGLMTAPVLLVIAALGVLLGAIIDWGALLEKITKSLGDCGAATEETAARMASAVSSFEATTGALADLGDAAETTTDKMAELKAEIRAAKEEAARAKKDYEELQAIQAAAKRRFSWETPEQYAVRQQRRAERTAEARAAYEAAAGVVAAKEAQLNADLLEEIRRLEIAAIEDTTARELAELDHRYEAKRKMAEAAGQDLLLVERAYQLELTAIQKRADDQREEAARRHAERMANERTRQAEELADKQASLADEIARLEIETTIPEGPDRQRALLALDEERDKRAIEQSGLGEQQIAKLLGMVTDKYTLRHRALALGDSAGKLKTTVAGTFSAIAASRLGGGDPLRKLVDKADQQIKELRKIQDGQERHAPQFT